MRAIEFKQSHNILWTRKIREFGGKFGIDVDNDGAIDRHKGDYVVTMRHDELKRLSEERTSEVLLKDAMADARARTGSWTPIPLDRIAPRMLPRHPNASCAIIVASDPRTHKPTDDIEFVIYEPKAEAATS